MTAFEDFVTTELPLRAATLNFANTGKVGDPNTFSEAQFVNAPVGTNFVDEQGGSGAEKLWQKQLGGIWEIVQSGQNIPSFGLAIDKEIFMRPTGDDATGDGTLGNPYLTIGRCLQDIPFLILQGQFYKINCSGMGTVVLPADLTFPQFTGDVRVDFDVGAPVWQSFFAPFTIWAEPTILDTVTGGDVVSQVGEPTHGLIKITTTKSFTPGALKGKMITGPPGSFASSTIWDNTATELFISQPFSFPTPFDIVEPSTKFTSPSGQRPFVFDAVRSANVISGLELEGAPVSFGIGYQTFGQPNFFAHLCKTDSISTTEDAVHSLQACVVDKAATVHKTQPQGVNLLSTVGTFWRGVDFDELGRRPNGFWQAFWNTFEGCNAISNYPSPGSSDGLMQTGAILLTNNRIASGSSDGVQFVGGGMNSRVEDTEIVGCAGDAVLIEGDGLPTLHNVQGAGNGGVGVRLANSGRAKREAGTAVTGVGGDYKVGGNPVGTWAGFGSDENDLGATPPQFCRLFI